MERINRYLAMCGVASRRGADRLIGEGRVTLNGQPLTEPGARIDPKRDEVAVDGQPVAPADGAIYRILNKPRGVISTASDPHAERTLEPWLSFGGNRLFSVGRLDRDSEGLLLLTNDGELANRLMHPRWHVEKEYRVSVEGEWSGRIVEAFRTGLVLDDGPTQPCQIFSVDAGPRRTRFSMTLREGRNRQIRRMCEAFDLRVVRLHRVRLGPIRLSGLKSGEARPLRRAEVIELRKCVGM